MVSCPIGCLPWPMVEHFFHLESCRRQNLDISNETANGKRKLDVEHDDVEEDDDDDDDAAAAAAGAAAVPSMLPSLP